MSLPETREAKSRVLIVDDMLDFRETLRLLLNRTYEVRTASSGRLALEEIPHFRPDLVILDIRMPEMDGLEVLRRVKQFDPTIEVVMITAYGSLETVKLALAHGAFEYLIKPVSRKDLEDVVRRVLARRPPDLDLRGNPGLGIPDELLQAHIEGQVRGEARPPLDYYRTGSARRPLNEAKLIFIGRGSVGKTSLVNRLIDDTFHDREKKTDGIRIRPWRITARPDETVRLNVWDFGGQEIMHATHQFFMTHRSLYVLVINGREGREDADAEYWLRLIESFAGASPVIVVLNKVLEQPFDVNRRALEQKFASVRAFVKTDCSDRTGIDELRAVIESETDNLEHVRDPFPAAWFSIKERLSGMADSVLTFDRYRAICAEHGEADEGAQESLAMYLHALGIALNYRDDPRLRDTHVLNPHWVTNGIYKLLNSNLLSEQQGVLRVDDVGRLLDPIEYPRRRHLFLLDLMRKFELCFPFPDEDSRFLVPQLLDKQQPATAEAFDAVRCLNFEYRYPILPEGLLPRVIVRTHALSAPRERWRTGVILGFEGCRALVKADAEDRRITISVDGPPASRRRLLAVIRSDFDHIHRSIAKLEPQEMVPVPRYPSVAVRYQELVILERNGRKAMDRVAGDAVLTLDIQELLNGVDLPQARAQEPVERRATASAKIFISYSHKDEDLRSELETHLKLMQRQGLVATWTDRRITGGQEWKEQIDVNLERSDIVLLLVSADFIASDYCYDKEMTRALELHDARKVVVVPVIVRDVQWRTAPFARLQALPRDGKPVRKWDDRDTAWRDVADGIEVVATRIRESPEPR